MSEPKLLFTVVIPSIGRTSLERAVLSAVHQTLRPMSIIVVENGRESFDRGRIEEISALANGVSTQVISLPPLSGPAVSRNIGAWAADTPFVAFLDDDDELSPRYLEMMSNAISELQPDILYASTYWLDESCNPIRGSRLDSIPSPLWLDRLYRHENPGFGGANVVARKSTFFEIGGFPVDLRSGEDRALAMAALAGGLRIAYVPDAEVRLYDPEGSRAKDRSDKWLTNLKLIHDYWGEVTWRTRGRSIWRWLRQFSGM